jgi:hypothetical protein
LYAYLAIALFASESFLFFKRWHIHVSAGEKLFPIHSRDC